MIDNSVVNHGSKQYTYKNNTFYNILKNFQKLYMNFFGNVFINSRLPLGRGPLKTLQTSVKTNSDDLLTHDNRKQPISGPHDDL